MSTPLERLRRLMAQGGMSRNTDAPMQAAPAQQAPVQQAPVERPVDPRVAQVAALMRQAETPSRPQPQGLGKQLLFSAVQGLRGAADPQGYAGLQAREQATERQRQQDLYSRVKELQGGIQTDRQFDLTNQREDRLAQAQQDSLGETRRLREIQESNAASSMLNNDFDNRMKEREVALKEREAAAPKASEDKEVHTYTGDDGFTYTDFRRPDGTTYPVKSSVKARATGGGTYIVPTVNESGQPVNRIVPRTPGAEYGMAPTADMRNREASRAKAAPVFTAIRSLSEKINVNQGVMAKAIGEVEKAKARVNLNNDLAVYNSTIAGFTPLIARSVGHTGVLTQQDVDSVRELFPAAGDSKELRDAKIANVEWIMDNITVVPGQSLKQSLVPYLGTAGDTPSPSGGGEKPRRRVIAK